MIGCFYLHTNGDLIFKPASVFFTMTPAEYFEGDLVVKWWELPDGSPTGEFEGDVKWSMDWMREAYELSSDKPRTEKRIREICARQNWPEMVANAIIEGKRAKVLRSEVDPEHPGPAIAISFEKEEDRA